MPESVFTTRVKNPSRICWWWSTAVFLAAGILFSGCAASRQEKILWEELGNRMFPSEWTDSGYAPLKNGTYREPASPGAASEVVVRLTDHLVDGNLAGRQSAAAVLVTEPGGSGSFYDLALLQRRTDEWEVVDLVLLGDRIRLTDLSLDGNSIRMDMITHGPGDPMCCPTRKSSIRFLVQNGRLRKTLPRAAMPLTGRVWKWRGTLHDSAGDTTPPSPNRYTIEFIEDGQVRVLADCNAAGGGFTVYQDRISVEIVYSTMATCPSTSLENIFTQEILAADTYYVHENQLHLKLTGSSGKMIFF